MRRDDFESAFSIAESDRDVGGYIFNLGVGRQSSDTDFFGGDWFVGIPIEFFPWHCPVLLIVHVVGYEYER